MTKSATTRLFILVFAAMSLALTATAQKNVSRVLSPEAIGIDIEQCANGPIAMPILCNTASGNDGYTRGNVNESKSHYEEGQFVPIRFIATDLMIGETYTVTLGYDFTKGGKYATDYLGSFDATEQNPLPNPPYENNPCVNVVGCNPSVFTTFGIPTDAQVTAGFDGMLGTGDDITQIPGVFTCYGCTITAISPYTLSGSTSGDSSKTFTLTFTATATNVVIAYGSHISTREDWGLTNSAVNISGSPYHNYVVDFPGANGGSRDLQLSATAVLFPANIVIEKTVLNAFNQTSGGQSFDFTAPATLFGSTTFSLTDLVAEPILSPGHPYADRRGGKTAESADIRNFGGTNLISVSENPPPTGWSLAQITCTSVNGTNNNTITLGTRTVAIQLEEGELVTCTFHNTQLTPTAAPASVSGRAVDSFGTGISGARITLVDAQSGQAFVAITNPFGYYTIDGPEVDNFYVMTISHKRYTFADDTRSFTLHDNLSGVDFVANP